MFKLIPFKLLTRRHNKFNLIFIFIIIGMICIFPTSINRDQNADERKVEELLDKDLFVQPLDKETHIDPSQDIDYPIVDFNDIEEETAEKSSDNNELDDEVPGWGRNCYRDAKLYILPNEKTATLQPSNICKENTPILLLIVIMSAVDHFENRKVLRETWAAKTNEFNYDKFTEIHSNSPKKGSPISFPDWRKYTINQKQRHKNVKDEKFQIRTVFLLGQTKNDEIQRKIVEEARVHDDIIQEGFVDSYNNLTLKSVMMLKFANDNCVGKVKFVMKVDDDVFVNVPNLIHYVLGGTIPEYEYNENDGLKQFDGVLFGYLFSRMSPFRDSEDKWYMPYYLYEASLYPEFISGCSYVFSMDVAVQLYKTAMSTPLIHLEDVYLSGICAEKAHINRQSANDLFDFFSGELCRARGLISLEQLDVDDIPGIYDSVMKSNDSC